MEKTAENQNGKKDGGHKHADIVKGLRFVLEKVKAVHKYADDHPIVKEIYSLIKKYSEQKK